MSAHNYRLTFDFNNLLYLHNIHDKNRLQHLCLNWLYEPAHNCFNTAHLYFAATAPILLSICLALPPSLTAQSPYHEHIALAFTQPA